MNVLETTQAVTEQSRYVGININNLNRFTRKWINSGFKIPAWDRTHHYSGDAFSTALYFFVLDTINFCFWSMPGRGRWELGYEAGYRINTINGYNAMAVALKRAFESKAPITQPEFLAKITQKDLKRALGGTGELQLMKERINGLQELGRVLVKEFDGEALNLIESAGNSAIRLAELIVQKLPSYRDVADYKGNPVFFYKRAQIIAADLYGAFSGLGAGFFNDMHLLTAFADYKLPQVLRQAGVLEYDETLSSRIDNLELLESGSNEEIEIRANTIRAIELIRRDLKGSGIDIAAYEIDWALWNLGQDPKYRQKPYHRTVTVFY